MAKITELWKTDCEDCEAAKPIVEELEREGLKFEKYNIGEFKGQKAWDSYAEEIDAYSKSQGWEEGYIYTPTFINPTNRKVIAFADRAPNKKELKDFAQS